MERAKKIIKTWPGLTFHLVLKECSSVAERCADNAEVGGSNPSIPIRHKWRNKPQIRSLFVLYDDLKSHRLAVRSQPSQG